MQGQGGRRDEHEDGREPDAALHGSSGLLQKPRPPKAGRISMPHPQAGFEK
jgi:hypothetical protein